MTTVVVRTVCDSVRHGCCLARHEFPIMVPTYRLLELLRSTESAVREAQKQPRAVRSFEDARQASVLEERFGEIHEAALGELRNHQRLTEKTAEIILHAKGVELYRGSSVSL